MNKTLNLHIAVMFLISLALNYISVTLLSQSEEASAYNIGFLFGRSMSSVLLPLAIIGIPLILFRRGKQKFTKGAYIALWVLFILLAILALFGSLLP